MFEFIDSVMILQHTGATLAVYGSAITIIWAVVVAVARKYPL